MKDAAICLFAWDLCDEGIDPVLEFLADAGVTSLYLASVYHAGWFLRPHNPRHKCYMPEDGAAYFHPTASLYEATPLRPKVARIAADTDWFAEVGRRLDGYGLRLTAWTVCNHNTPLGLRFPEHTVRNAFGDSYPNALSPASPAVRAYVRALSRDLASKYPLQSIFLEAPNYRGRRHGHHHERELMPLGPLEIQLLDISFSDHDLACAGAAGVDGQAVQAAVRGHLESYFASVPDRPAGMPETIEQFQSSHPMVTDYLAVLDGQVASLLAEVKEDLRPSGVELEGVGQYSGFDVVLVGGYGKEPEEVARLTREARRRAEPRQRIRVGLRLGMDPPDRPTYQVITSPQKARECVSAAVENGADAVWFFNYSESPRPYLNWIKPAIAGMISPPRAG
jgi:hypothetical protein